MRSIANSRGACRSSTRWATAWRRGASTRRSSMGPTRGGRSDPARYLIRRRRDGHAPIFSLDNGAERTIVGAATSTFVPFFLSPLKEGCPMVIRKRDEAGLPPIPPIPTQVVTNGEFVPLPTTQKQRAVDLRRLASAARYGKPRGLARRG